MVVLALFLASLAPMLSASALLRRQQELIAEATDLAQLEIEEIRRTWGALDARSGLEASQSLGGLTPINMRDRIVPLPQPCILSAATTPTCTQDPPVAPELPRLPPSDSYPFAADGFEAVSTNPSGEGPDDLYLYDPNQITPATSKAAGFTMAGLRGPATYYVQVFWGYAPGSSTPAQALDNSKWYRDEIVRVVVRLYLADSEGTLPEDSEGQPTRLTRAVRPVLNASRTRDLADNSAKTNDPNAASGFTPLAPLVVLTTDIPRTYQ